jgi:hypothetical protein
LTLPKARRHKINYELRIMIHNQAEPGNR